MMTEIPREAVLKYRNSAEPIRENSWDLNMFAATVSIWTPFLLSNVVMALSLYFIFLTRYGLIPLSYIAWIIYDRHTYSRGSRGFSFMRKLSMWNKVSDYFDIKLVKTADLDPKMNYLLGSHPHGILPSGVFGALVSESRDVSRVFPGIQFRNLTTEAFNYLPVIREFFHSIGACSANKESMDYLLSTKGGGQAPILVPGGGREAIESHQNSNVLYLKNRKGFIKLALRHGAPLVPVFTFGETDIFGLVSNPPGSVIRLIQNICQRFQEMPFFPVKNFIPNRVPLTVVVGAPIQMEKSSNPTQEDIDTLHTKYMNALSELYYKYRDLYAPNKTVDLQFI